MPKTINAADVKEIVFICEAGIGSSLMSVNALKKKFRKAGISDVKVYHSATTTLDENANFIICHMGLLKSARAKAPEAVIVGFKLFFNDPIFDVIVEAFADGKDIEGTEIK
jgi:mannitol-specific phosphotransferase system IIBC component